MEAYMNEIIIDGTTYKDSIDLHLLMKHTNPVKFQDVIAPGLDSLEHLYILSSRAQLLQDFDLRRAAAGCYINDARTWLLLCGPTPLEAEQVISKCTARLERLKIRFSDLNAIQIGHLTGLKELFLLENPHMQRIDGLQMLGAMQKLTIAQNACGKMLDISGMTMLEELEVIVDEKLEQIIGLPGKPRLNLLYVSCDSLSGELDLTGLTALQHMNIDGGFHRIRLSHTLAELKHFRLYITPLNRDGDPLPFVEVENFDFLRFMPALEHLTLQIGSLKHLPDLTHCTQLYDLNLHGSGVEELGSLPEGVENLCLSSTHIRRLPECIRDLRYLNLLNLNNLNLEELPVWLDELSLPVYIQKREVKTGITLFRTTVKGMDMTMFPRQQGLLRGWLEQHQRELQRGEKPINEIKVVLLGDSEAGKSLVVQRLLTDGAHPAPGTFDGDTTPGIAIHHHTMRLDDRVVRVHFWDFGGQEILHAMHRIFQTQRTIYVVVLNARHDTQDERARFWLRCIKSFDSRTQDQNRILFVLNKTDQNPRASIDMTQLRLLRSDLPDVVMLSAKEDPPEAFNGKLLAALKREISGMENLSACCPMPWYRVRQRLEHTDKNLVKYMDFEQICQEEGVENIKQIREDLLEYLSTLGVGFPCRDAEIGRYVLLRPEWFTNAIYKIIFNKHLNVRNGIIPYHDVLNSMLRTGQDSTFRSVLPKQVYEEHETSYILKVMRQNDLSFKLENAEFIPMLCGRETKPAALSFLDDPDTEEVWWQFDYLPDALLFRLMVDEEANGRHNKLDYDNVWLTGAVFRNDKTGQNALVRRDGNTLKIYTRTDNPQYSAADYMKTMEQILYRIVERCFPSLLDPAAVAKSEEHRRNDIELLYPGIRRRIILNINGERESFDYHQLKMGIHYGSTLCYSRLLNRCVPADEILNRGKAAENFSEQMLIRDILESCSKLQGNPLYWETTKGKKEDSRNTFLRDLLESRHYLVYDQTFNGTSASGLNLGELDLLIKEDPNTPWAIIEALNLKNPKYWKEHLIKLVENYNPQGLKTLFLVCYVTNKTREEFNQSWIQYYPLMCSHSTTECRVIPELCGLLPSTYLEKLQLIHAAYSTYEYGGAQTKVYHIFVRLGQ